MKFIIDRMPLVGGFSRTLIDVKVQDLDPSIYSCVPGWHLDGKPMSRDRHHLVVLNGPLTEFVAEPLDLDINDLRVPDQVQVRTIRPNSVNSYTSFDFHRGVRATEPTRRLLVRVTETDTIHPNNKPKAPSHGARRKHDAS